MTPLPIDSADGVLPDGRVARILILRTAQLAEVQWARAELARRYPRATVGILGTRLTALGAFEDCARFELPDGWLTPATIAPLQARLDEFAPDLLVMCLNNDWHVGYDKASRVMRRISARHKVVAGYDRRWSRWRHVDFGEMHPVVRWLTDLCGLLILAPAVWLYLLMKPAGPPYAGTPRTRPRGEARA